MRVSHTAMGVGPVPLAKGAVDFRIWAPNWPELSLVLLDGEKERVIPMTRDPWGYFSHVEPNIATGQRYRLQLPDGSRYADPASRWQPEGVHGPSAVFRHEEFSWSDQSWRGLPLVDLVIYELHVGTFTPTGTFDAIHDRLDALKTLGVTAIELLPVAQFPGTRNWGYDGAYLYAVQNSYGGPQSLQRLVDACHAKGLAIILDVVYNHFGPEGNYLPVYAPAFTDRYHTPWGSAVNFDDAGSDGMRAFVVENARRWIEEFHFDGLRLDAVHAIFDFSPQHILRDIHKAVAEAAQRQQRQVHVIAESDMNDVRLLEPPEKGGYGLEAQWSDDFHHAVHTLVTGEKQGYYEDFGAADDLPRVLVEPFLYNGVYSPHRGRHHGTSAAHFTGDRFVVSIQNHDQVGNRARGDRFATLITPAQQRLAACLLLLAPHVPMIFMGDEYGEQNPFLFFCSFEDTQLVENVRAGRKREFAGFAWQGEVPDPQSEITFAASRLSWRWPEGTVQAGIRHLYADLLSARQQWPALRDFVHRAARLLPSEPEIVEFIRGNFANNKDETLVVWFNLTDETKPFPGEHLCGKTVLFSSEGPRYHGQRPASKPLDLLLPHECVVGGPRSWTRFWG